MKPHLKGPSPEAEILHQVPKFRPLALRASSKLLPSPPTIGGLGVRKWMGEDCSVVLTKMGRVQIAVAEWSAFWLMVECAVVVTAVARMAAMMVAQCENERADLYYQKRIEGNPEKSLLLGYYARFLMEVRGDLIKAQEYCGRAISANSNDGIVLSMYADLIWKNRKDASRAESYHVQAAKASPSDKKQQDTKILTKWDVIQLFYKLKLHKCARAQRVRSLNL